MEHNNIQDLGGFLLGVGLSTVGKMLILFNIVTLEIVGISINSILSDFAYFTGIIVSLSTFINSWDKTKSSFIFLYNKIKNIFK